MDGWAGMNGLEGRSGPEMEMVRFWSGTETPTTPENEWTRTTPTKKGPTTEPTESTEDVALGCVEAGLGKDLYNSDIYRSNNPLIRWLLI